MMIGIDLGTTNSLVAYFSGEKPVLLPNRLGSYLTPSVVSVDADGTVYVGETARQRAGIHPLDTARVFKRSMGTERVYALAGKKFTAQELSGLILRSLKEDAETFLQQPVTQAIISVPAYFNDLQRKATVRAGELAGLSVERIINEPTAAALAHGIGLQDAAVRVLVFDLGGGTFDVSVLELYHNIMEVHAIAGDNFIGGEDFTEVLSDLFLRTHGIAPQGLGRKEQQLLYEAAEACKLGFSHSSVSPMRCVLEGTVRESEFSLSEYEEACAPLLEKIRRPIERSLRDAGMLLADIDQIVLVGGATKLPVVRKFVAKLFGRIPGAGVNPDEAVALGAALQCGMKARNEAVREMILTDVCPFTLGTSVVQYNGTFKESGHYLPIIERNTVIPVSRTHTFYTAQDDQEQVRVKILQGESRLAHNNLFLGELLVPVPRKPESEESVDVTYTYDINALLEVQVRVNSTGAVRKMLIQGAQDPLDEAQARARMEALAYLKISPREEESNKLLLFRGERLYEESTSHTRQEIDQLLSRFERALEGQNKAEIERVRREVSEQLDYIEALLRQH